MFSLDFLAKVYDYLVIIYYFVCVNMKDLSFQSRILNLLRLLNINLGVNFNDWTTLRKKKKQFWIVWKFLFQGGSKI